MTTAIEFAIPDVPAPTNPFLGYWGAQLVVGHFSEKPLVITLSSTFVRCVFSAREDYLAAKQHLLAAYQASREIHLSELYRCISRFESCISSVYSPAHRPSRTRASPRPVRPPLPLPPVSCAAGR